MDGNAENAEFHDTLRAWLQAALPLLEPYRQPFGQDPSDSRDARLFAGALFRFGMGIPELDETKRLAAALSRMPEFVHRGEGSHEAGTKLTEGNAFQAQAVVAEFALYYLRVPQGGGFAPAVFAELYAELEDYLYRFDGIPIKTTMELWNAESDAAPVPLAGDVAIRAPTDDERARSRDAARGSLLYPPAVSPTPDIDEGRPTPTLLIEVERPARDWATTDAPKPYTIRFGSASLRWFVGHRVLLALRLLGRERVWLGHAWTTPGNRFLGSDLDAASDAARTRPASWEERFGIPNPGGLEPTVETSPYRIGSEHVARLAALYAFLDSGTKLRRELNVPLRRFEMSFGRSAPVERFVDLWIALEALFSPGGAESSYRMQQFIAQFVGRDARDRWATYSTAKASYKARNDVLHGRRFLSAEELARHGEPTEDYARRALLTCIEERRKPNRDDLERDIFLQGADPLA